MANDRNRNEGFDETGSRDVNDEQVRGGAGEDVRGIADEGDEEFDDTEELEDEEDSDAM